MINPSYRSLCRSLPVIACLLCLVFNAEAQAPQLIPYQAIARDLNGQAVLNQNISLRFSVHNLNVSGPIVWQEMQSVVSNNLGVIVTQLGVNNSLLTIDWGSGSKYLQVEMDISGGSNYLEMGTQQMMSVPYALYAENAGNSNSSNITSNLPPGTAVGNTMYWDGAQWVLNNQNIYNAGGNVGIGDSSPSHKLSVIGSIGLSGTINAIAPQQNIQLVPGTNGLVEASNTRVSKVAMPADSSDAVNAKAIQFNYLTFANDVGNTNAFVTNVPVQFANYSPGLQISFIAQNANSGACTMSINGLPPVSLKKNVSSDLSSGDILAGQVVTLIYDGQNFQVTGGISSSNSNSTVGFPDPLIFTVDGF